MESKSYICEGNKFAYSKGYIGLPVVINDLPQVIEIEGVRLQRKNSFHVSLVCVKVILAKKSDVEQVVLDEFCRFANINDISFIRYTGEFRLAEHEDRRSLVALCEVSNLNEFLESLSIKLGIDIPHQPTHVTLFTLQPEMGIGINSPTDMEVKSTEIAMPPEIKEALDI